MVPLQDRVVVVAASAAAVVVVAVPLDVPVCIFLL
jgi:hypothetical protein